MTIFENVGALERARLNGRAKLLLSRNARGSWLAVTVWLGNAEVAEFTQRTGSARE